MPEHRALVIGAGIGGLTAAIALHHRGWQVTVLERAEAVAPVGAGIAVAPNGQRALDVVGLGDRLRELAAWQGAGGLRTPSGRWLSRTDVATAAERYGGPIVIVHRAVLFDLLAARLPAGTLRTGVRAELADPGDAERPARVRTDAGDLEAGLVVGADGIHSGTRTALFPGHPAPGYAGFTAWRLVVPAPAGPFTPHETWGRGGLWGSQPLEDGRVYAYATALVPEDGHAPDGELAELRRRFGGWHHPVPALLEAARPDDVLRGDVRHLPQPLPAFHRGRTALLGDAAHPMTPNLGQGGNQAIEDAVVLAHHAAPDHDPGPALERYTRDRLPRTTDVVRRSAQAARISQQANPLARALRDAALSAAGLLAPGLLLRGGDGIMDWRPPAAPYASRAA